MKHVTILLAGFAIFMMASCGEKKEKETVIIEKQVEAPKAEESDGTSLSIDNDGVEFSTKDGDDKTEISIKD